MFLLVQPAIAKRHKGDLGELMQSSSIIFQRLMHFQEMAHVGTGFWHNVFEPTESRDSTRFVTLRFYTGAASIIKIPWQEARKTAKMSLTCDGDCGFHLGINLTKSELQEILFFLMLKHILPEMPSCNFINCQEIEKLEADNLGLISISDRFFSGNLPDVYPFQGNFSLAFTFMTGLNMTKGFHGLDSWGKFIMLEKMRRDAKAYEAFIRLTQGPKPRKGSRR